MNLEKHSQAKANWIIIISCLAIISYLIYEIYVSEKFEFLKWVMLFTVGVIFVVFGEKSETI